MKLSKKQASVIEEIKGVLKRYSSDDYDPDVIVEVLSRAMRKGKRGKRNLSILREFPIPQAQPYEIIKEQRKRLGLSILALVNKTGIVQPNLSAMENGKRPIGAAVAKKLGKALGIDYRVLL